MNDDPQDVTTVLDDLAALAAALGLEDLARRVRTMRDRHAAREWLVVLLGETSVGKSTWINTLLGDDVLPASAGATTACAIEVRVSAAVQEPRFERVCDGRTEQLDRATFRSLAVKTDPARRLRLYWPASRVGTTVDARSADGLVLLDTPGYNACETDHAAVLAGVLSEADAVVSLLSFQRGFTPEDREFLGRVQDRAVEVPLLFAVNWLPTAGGERKLCDMRAKAAACVGQDVRLEPLRTWRVAESPRIWNDALWAELAGLAHSAIRQGTVRGHILAACNEALVEIDAALAARAAARSATEAQLEPLRQRIVEIRSRLGTAEERIARTRRDLEPAIWHICMAARDGLWGQARDEIEDSGRFTEAGTCTAFVREHLVPHHLERARLGLEDRLNHAADELSRDLDELLGDAEVPGVGPIRVQGPPAERVRDAVVPAGARRVVGGMATGYLERLGGVAGKEAGFVNLAKKVVSKSGALFDKKFARPVYDNMGRALRRIGLKAGFATAAFAAALVEALAYLYRVARWKKKLLGLLEHVLGLPPQHDPIEDAVLRRFPLVGGRPRRPFEELAVESVAAVDDALAATLDLARTNVSRRLEVLQGSLDARGRPVGEDAGLHRTRAAIAERIRRLQEEKP